MSEISKEQLFLQNLQKTVQEARENGGVITKSRLEEIFAAQKLSEEQMNQVLEYLKVNKIGVNENLPQEELLTEEEHDYLQDYLEMLELLPQPTAGELEALKLSAMAGESAAQNQLAQIMLPKVVDIARLYAGQGVLMEDLIGGGNEALARGVRLLAPLEGPEEVEGALGRRIMDTMEDLIAEQLDAVARDREIETLVNLIADKAAELAGEVGHKVAPEELAHEGEVTLEQIEEALRYSGSMIEDIEQK